MRTTKPYLLIAPLVALIVASLACQTAQRPAALLQPAQANAPALTAVAVPTPQATANPKPTPTQQAQPQPKPDPVADLIAQAEKEYQAGQENLKGGKLEAARQNFEHALDLLGNQEYVLSDERAQREFDKILEAENSPELAALQQGDGGPEQKLEPAPIDEVNAVTPPVDARIKAQAEADVKATRSDLPLMLTDPVAGYINYFSTRGHETLEHALERSGRYQEMIQHILKEQGVPQELIYLAQAESGFHPLAVSRAGARGMWPFMEMMPAKRSGYLRPRL